MTKLFYKMTYFLWSWSRGLFKIGHFLRLSSTPFYQKSLKTQPLKKSRDYFFLDHLFISKNQVPNTSLPIMVTFDFSQASFLTIEPHTCNFSPFSPCITLWLIAPSESKKITLFIKSSTLTYKISNLRYNHFNSLSLLKLLSTPL